MPIIRACKQAWEYARNGSYLLSAFVWRRLVRKPVFIAITGSVGKSTCMRCLDAILREEGTVTSTYNAKNGSPGVFKMVLRARNAHRFSLIEIGINGRRQMERRAGAVRPNIAVLLAIAQVHRAKLRSLDEVEREKRKILDAVVPGGTAVLNGEDARVRKLSSSRLGKIVLFGNCADSVAWATEMRTSLDAGLTFRAHTPEGSAQVHLNLYGTHWLPSVLAAIAVARELGIPLARTADSLERLIPVPARMQPVRLPNGATLLRDEHNGSFFTATKALKFLASQPATRRWVVWSDVSDTSKSPKDRIRWLLQQVETICDGLVFVGELGPIAAEMAKRSGFADDRVYTFTELPDAAQALPSILGPGDLALLRGRTFDHLERLVHAQFGSVECWKTNCRRRNLCDRCEELRAGTSEHQPAILPLWRPQPPTVAK